MSDPFQIIAEAEAETTARITDLARRLAEDDAAESPDGIRAFGRETGTPTSVIAERRDETRKRMAVKAEIDLATDDNAVDLQQLAATEKMLGNDEKAEEDLESKLKAIKSKNYQSRQKIAGLNRDRTDRTRRIKELSNSLVLGCPHPEVKSVYSAALKDRTDVADEYDANRKSIEQSQAAWGSKLKQAKENLPAAEEQLAEATRVLSPAGRWGTESAFSPGEQAQRASQRERAHRDAQRLVDSINQTIATATNTLASLDVRLADTIRDYTGRLKQLDAALAKAEAEAMVP